MRQHVPGAVHLSYERIIDAKPPAMGLLPDDWELGAVFSSLGMTPHTHVVAYDDEGNGKVGEADACFRVCPDHALSKCHLRV